MNPLKELSAHGQSFWLDFISRPLFNSGQMKRYIEEDDLRGMTSNPTIFEKSISGGNEYDADLKKLAAQGKSNEEIFIHLAVADIQKAADYLRPVFKSTGGTDGFVSLEVTPTRAYDTQGTIEEALRFVKMVNRPNLMIKVPGTKEGLPAIEELTARGINVNITLLFSLENYKKVLEAYLRGLERRVKKNQPVKSIASVASFFVSRVDTVIDKMLEQKVSEGNQRAAGVLHKGAIANAKLAYAHFESVTKSPRWAKLAKKGAHVQRVLWASTSTKDKRMPDTIYVDNLIGPDTVNTMPPQLIDAFRDHGSVKDRVLEGVPEAEETISTINQIGIDFESAMQQLQHDGVRSFSESYEALIRVVGAKRELLSGEILKGVALNLGSSERDFEQALQRIQQDKWISRVWSKDATVWKSDEEHRKIITNSLGWLNVVSIVKRRIKRVEDIVADVRKAKFTHALLLGMGGSSLCPEVIRQIFGKKAGYPDLAILDSTEPASVLSRAHRSKPEKTLYIVASKSGSTTEPNAFLAYFYEQVRKKKGSIAGENFIAITDPGTTMERSAIDKKFRHIVLNPSDIGGRYSALSFFGMAPAAIMGAPVKDILMSASKMADACSSLVPADKNPGALLGAALGTLAKAGRDKVTFALSKDIASFSTWVEQLIAESTGKEGRGILPVESEPLKAPEFYGTDRVFVYIHTGKAEAAISKKLEALKKAGHPIITIQMKNKKEIGGQFFLWEFATAISGALLGIDAFDQPNVQESKDLTKQYLEQFKQQGKLAVGSPSARLNGLSVYASNGGSSVEATLKTLLNEVKPGDYVALLAYIERNPAHEAILQQIRDIIQTSKHVATTVGFGPRFLHSTGQLHKGGADNGVFIQITADDKKDVEIPGEPYTYSVLKQAQALGDLTALQHKNRRVIRVHLADVEKGLAKLKDLLQTASSN